MPFTDSAVHVSWLKKNQYMYESTFIINNTNFFLDTLSHVLPIYYITASTNR